MKLLLSSLITATIVMSTSIMAEEKYRHFPSVASPDLSTALCNLQNYNKKLMAILNQDKLGAEDMVKIHELTYTLEDAVAKIQQDLVVTAENLEGVHKASETLEEGKLRGFAKHYTKQSGLLIDAAKCVG